MNGTLNLREPLPIGSVAHRASGWWGMWCLIATEGALFGYLLFSYFYLGSQSQGPFVPEMPKLRLSLPNTVLLIASSFVLAWGEKGIRKGMQSRLRLALALTILMGAAFIGVQWLEWKDKKFLPWDSAYASSYFVTTGFHMMHVLCGLLILLALLVWALLGNFDSRRHAAVSIGALYWHFVDVVWLAVFASYYLSPRWLGAATS